MNTSRSSMVLKSMSPRWLLSQHTLHTYVDVMGNVSGLNALPQELIEEIVSRTSPLDVCGKLSIVSRRFQSAAKSDHVWERFLPTDLISRRAKPNESHFMMFAEDPWKKIDSDTLKAFPTKKDLNLFVSDNPLIIDEGHMVISFIYLTAWTLYKTPFIILPVLIGCSLVGLLCKLVIY